MDVSLFSKCLQCCLLTLLMRGGEIYADVVPMNNIGNSSNNSIVDVAGSITSVSGGVSKGSNLFHSFSEFSVEAGSEVKFLGNDSINHIFNRVIGGNVSTIDGVISSDIKNVNLYILNPSGVLFGKQAKIDISGSFFVSTADEIKFSGGGRFGNIANENVILTTQPPAAFGFLQGNSSAEITISAGQLEVSEGNTIMAVVAEDQGLRITDGSIRAENGHIVLKKATSQKDVLINAEYLDTADQGVDSESTFSASSNQLALLTKDLSIDGTVEVGGEGLVRIVIDVDNLELLNGGLITTQTVAEEGSSGNIEVKAVNSILLDGSASSIQADSAFGSENSVAGNISLEAPKITLSGGVLSSTYFQLSSSIATELGSGGSIEVNADTLEMTEAAAIRTFARSAGNAGKISIHASENIFVRGKDTSITSFSTRGSSQSGVINISAPSIEISDGAILVTSSDNTLGDAGDINILNARNFRLENEGHIRSTTNSEGKGGNIKIESDQISISDQSGIAVESNYSSRNKGVAGDAGTISISTGQGEFNLTAGSTVSANTTTTGHGGRIDINTGVLKIGEGSTVSASSQYADDKTPNDYTLGDAGALNIKAKSIHIDAGAVSVSSVGADGGDVVTNVDTKLIVDNGGAIQTSVSGGEGDGGNVLININEANTGKAVLLLNNGSTITARAEGVASIGDGGSILINDRIDRNAIALSDNSEIRAGTSAISGKGGKIVLKGQAFFSRDILDSQVTATAPDKKNVGEVATFEPEFDVKTATISLPSALFDASSISATRCLNRNSNVSNFYISERPGIASTPDSLMAGYSDSAIAVQHDDQSGNSGGRMEDSLNVDVAIVPAGFCVN